MNEEKKINLLPFYGYLVALVFVGSFILITDVHFGKKQPTLSDIVPEKFNKISLGEGQFSCKLADVYKKEIDKCEPVFPPKDKDFVSEAVIVRTSRVIDVVTAKKGQGCTELTKGTWLPLDKKGCGELVEKYKRTSMVKTTFNGRFVEVTTIGMIVQEGERWYLIEDEKGNLMWKIPNG